MRLRTMPNPRARDGSAGLRLPSSIDTAAPRAQRAASRLLTEVYAHLMKLSLTEQPSTPIIMFAAGLLPAPRSHPLLDDDGASSEVGGLLGAGERSEG